MGGQLLSGVSVDSGDAMSSLLWGRYVIYYSVPCHEVLVHTRMGDLILTQQLLLDF